VAPGLPTVQIELEMNATGKGKVVVVNRGSAKVRLWRPGNRWGDETLSFNLAWDNHTERVTRKPQIYTRNVPASVVVASNGKQDIPFDLGDGSWEPAAAVERLSATGTKITAIYSVRKSPEALSHHVWTGELRSPPARLE